jgi:hypothetical protein
MQSASTGSAIASSAARGRADARLAALIERQLHTDAAPQRLFDPAAIALAAPVDRVFLMRSWERPDVAVTPVAGAEVAARMPASLRYERAPLLACYEQFRFAFPGRANPLLEEAPAREAALLAALLDGRDAYAVDHPYPVDLTALHEAMRPYC